MKPQDLFETAEGEYAEAIDIGVEWDAGAPTPTPIQASSTVLLFYLRYSYRKSEQDEVGAIHFDGGPAVLGWPNEDICHGHRLYYRGLSDGGTAFVVRHSSWVAEYVRVASVHEHADLTRLSTLQHYVLLFHDDTFECLAHDYKTRRFSTSSMA